MGKKFNNQSELFEYTKTIEGKKVKDISNKDIKGKGKVGLAVEHGFFDIKQNNNEEPDFEHLAVELKVAPLKRTKKDGLKPKERVSLSMLDLEDLIKNEDIRKSNKWKKIKNILMVWYIHEKDYKESEFVKTEILEMENTKYFAQIQEDWKKLHIMAKNGEAHMFSESLTKYLGLARKGGKNDSFREQRLNPEKGYLPRAFTLKTHLLSKIFEIKFEYTKCNIINDLKAAFLNKKFKEIKGFSEQNPKNKKILPTLIAKHFGVNSLGQLSDLIEKRCGEKFTFKTFNYKLDKNGEVAGKESMKFNVQPWSNIGLTWEESEFSELFENPFIFITYQHHPIIGERIIKDIQMIVFDEKVIAETIDAYNKYMSAFAQDAWKGEKVYLPKKISDHNLTHLRNWATNSKNNFGIFEGKTYYKLGIWINDKDMLKILKII